VARRDGPVAAGREPLSRARVLRAATELADRDGLGALSMRRLAEALAVEAMTLYYYVANKDALLAGMVDLVMGEIDMPSDEADWSAAIRRSARSAHAVLLRHPWAPGLMISPKHIGPARVRYTEWLLGRLRGAGFSAEMAQHAYDALDSHTIGSTLWESGGLAATKEEWATAMTFLRGLPADEYPYLTEHLAVRAAPARPGEPTSFELGLDLILDGLARMRQPR
jgi:AcrR family transcriptional regulator